MGTIAAAGATGATGSRVVSALAAEASRRGRFPPASGAGYTILLPAWFPQNLWLARGPRG